METQTSTEGQGGTVAIPTPSGGYTEEELGMLKKRAKVLEELVTTERKYQEDLYTLIMFYITPLRRNFAAELAKASKDSFLAHTQNARAAVRVEQSMGHTDRAEGLESDWDVELQFKSVEALFDMNGDFLTDLEKHMATSPDTCITDCLVPFSAKVREYSSFCVRQEATQIILKDLIAHNAKFRNLLMQSRSVGREKLDIFDLLIKPFQRALKYPLLMKELLRCTPKNHPDAAGTEEALRGMEAAVADINNAKSLAEKTRRIVTVCAQLLRLDDDSSKLKDRRSFIFEGDVNISSGRKVKPRHCFLFTDVFVFCEEKNGRLTVSGVASLLHVVTEKIDDDWAKAQGMPLNSWKMVSDTKKHSGTIRSKSTIISCATPEEKDQWLKLLRQTIQSAIMEQNQIEHEAEMDFYRKHPEQNCVSFNAAPAPAGAAAPASGAVRDRTISEPAHPPPASSHHKKKQELRLTLNNVTPISGSEGGAAEIPAKPQQPAPKPAAKRKPPTRTPPMAPPPTRPPPVPAAAGASKPGAPAVPSGGKPPVPPSTTRPPVSSSTAKPPVPKPPRPGGTPTSSPRPTTPTSGSRLSAQVPSSTASPGSRLSAQVSSTTAPPPHGSRLSAQVSPTTAPSPSRAQPPVPARRAAPPPPNARRPAPPPPSS